MRHDLLYRMAFEKIMDGLLLNLARGRTLQKPANESNPETISQISIENLPDAVQDEKKRNRSTQTGCNQSSFPQIMADSPNDGAENSASIQWKTRDQIEER